MNLLETTIVRIFQQRVRENGEATFVRYWKDGAWRDMSWREYGDMVKKAGVGLLALGAGKGDSVCIMSGTRAEWGIADLATLSIGCVTGAIYPTILGKDVSYIINDMRAAFVFAETAVQRNEILAFRQGMPSLRKVIVIDDDAGDDPLCMGFSSLLRLGEQNLLSLEKAFHDAVERTRQEDTATVIYTSGTTGIPKGAVHDHRSIVYTAANNVYPFEPGMVDLSFLPLAHVFERFGGFFGTVLLGNTVIGYWRGDMKGIVADFMELKPHVNRTVPRLLEKVYSAITASNAAKGEEAKRKFDEALRLAKAVRVDEALYGVKADEKTHREFDEAMKENPFAMLHQVLGGNMKFFYGGGAPIPKEVTEFFFAAGVPVYELYGTTETIGTVTNYPGKVRPGTVGVPFPMTGWPGEPGETRLAADGEIENRGPNVMKGYLNQPEMTREALTDDGWFRTGDLGEMDEQGFITITGRKKDIIITSGGKNIAPQRIENHFKETGYFSQVLVYGDRKKHLTALFTLDPSMVPALAMKLGIDISGIASEDEKYRTVASDGKTREFISTVVDERNRGLFKQERIVRFILLDRDLKPELDEVTPTMKLRKKNVIARFASMLDELYEKD